MVSWWLIKCRKRDEILNFSLVFYCDQNLNAVISNRIFKPLRLCFMWLDIWSRGLGPGFYQITFFSFRPLWFFFASLERLWAIEFLEYVTFPSFLRLMFTSKALRFPDREYEYCSWCILVLVVLDAASCFFWFWFAVILNLTGKLDIVEL